MSRLEGAQNSGIDILAYDGAGFHVLTAFGGWRIAVCNLAEQECPHTLQKHLDTDEAFVLLRGAGVLLEAGDGDEPQAVHAVALKPETVYNVRRNVWHAHQMEADSALLIVENRDTGEQNSLTAAMEYRQEGQA